MNDYLATCGAALFAGTGAWIGYRFSRIPNRWWVLGYFIPLALVVTYGLAVRVPSLGFLPPISWMMMGRQRFALIGFISAMVLTTPLSRLPLKRDRTVVGVLAMVIVSVMAVFPFLAPAFNHERLARLETQVGTDGVCRQTTEYTCGPAAAVTALRKLGLSADEGPLAVLCHTSQFAGTEPDVLAETLRDTYRKDGLKANYRPFKNLAELRQAGLTLAVVKFGLMVDHFITVLEVTDTEVLVGDPLSGFDRLSHDEFLRKWRFVGVVLQR